ncbi:DUF5337 family protein [Jannaschia rubra]|uniref:DUF5337 domain-containing protein n=1 Tax=Jannaschia rubra TaxID=282197 RepID=A0A0M6XTJ3_9RHOB|nr:DUF5337 family protein [Jannaschia rubra]CTQ33573.1 hypothetical protein JAN5088_02355 [Jannaschia rubra]SFG04148.1 hypothetical protein SAMN04488517_102402 [Jannaschia rubra]
MTGPSDLDVAIAKRSARVAIVILAVFLGWALLQFLGAQFDLSRRVMGLGDSVALVGMAWAIYDTVMIWRMRRMKE